MNSWGDWLFITLLGLTLLVWVAGVIFSWRVSIRERQLLLKLPKEPLAQCAISFSDSESEQCLYVELTDGRICDDLDLVHVNFDTVFQNTGQQDLQKLLVLLPLRQTSESLYAIAIQIQKIQQQELKNC